MILHKTKESLSINREKENVVEALQDLVNINTDIIPLKR